MTRKKVKLAYIINDANRKITYKKRKKGLLKKIQELTTLCDVQACAVIYSQYDAPHPEVWPSTLGAQRVYHQLKLLPEMDQTKRMESQETFLRQRIEKVKDKLLKQRRDNHEKEMRNVMLECLTGKPLQGISLADLNDMGWLIDRSLRDINDIIKGRNEEMPPPQNEDQFQAPPAPATAVTVAVTGQKMVPSGENMNMDMQKALEMRAIFETNGYVENMNMNSQANMGFGHPWDEVLRPFGEPNNNHALWSKNAFLP